MPKQMGQLTMKVIAVMAVTSSNLLVDKGDGAGVAYQHLDFYKQFGGGLKTAANTTSYCCDEIGKP